MSTPGLRERKKARTRETIVREALALFAERGFEPTTIADIAAAADIAPRTFFAYFPSKEAVVFHDFDEVVEQFAERLRTRPAGETAFDALRAWVRAWLADDERGREQQLRRALVTSSPALQARDRANFAVMQELLAEGVAQDLGVEPDALRAQMVAAAAVAALDVLAQQGTDDDLTDPESAMAVLDEALSFLQGGLEALRSK